MRAAGWRALRSVGFQSALHCRHRSPLATGRFALRAGDGAGGGRGWTGCLAIDRRASARLPVGGWLAVAGARLRSGRGGTEPVTATRLRRCERSSGRHPDEPEPAPDAGRLENAPAAAGCYIDRPRSDPTAVEESVMHADTEDLYKHRTIQFCRLHEDPDQAGSAAAWLRGVAGIHGVQCLSSHA